jgi:tetratricopeptide (TPR) repeat protein
LLRARGFDLTDAVLCAERLLGDRQRELALLHAMAVGEERVGDLYKALVRVDEAHAGERAWGDRAGVALAMASKGRLLRKLGRYDEAIALLEESIAIARDVGQKEAE